ncbi:MAG: DNA recombination protein RmuC [Gammaproteobacteria bacterium]|nr:DNA recombination protein RmuC [Gammaproteobacteria bacterium]
MWQNILITYLPNFVLLAALLWLFRLMGNLKEREQSNQASRDAVMQLLRDEQHHQQLQRTEFDEHQLKNLKTIIESLQSGMQDIRLQITSVLTANATQLGQQLDKLTSDTDARLKEISGQVEKRLTEGFEKTTATFTDIVKRLALIDAAQQKITDLSNNVISLQEILTDKRSRGAFGEVQLSALIHNVIPAEHIKMQYTLSNGKRADCILFLPEPTGNIVIDAKFPLESFQRLYNVDSTEAERNLAKQQFRIDIKKHIKDIAEKYIIPGETADGALMFIPAEAVFAEIHGHYPDLVEFSHKSKVWMVSPTTMMAILTTARAVIKDAATREQVHIIQEHLLMLSKDFERFQIRMDNLAKHINQAHSDVEDVHKSSKKILSRFASIEQVDLGKQLETTE